MMICSDCRTLMKNVMRFDGKKSYQLCRCPKCYSETRPMPFIFNPIRKHNKNRNTSPETHDTFEG